MFLVTCHGAMEEVEGYECSNVEHVRDQIQHLMRSGDYRPADIQVWTRTPVRVTKIAEYTIEGLNKLK